MAQNVSELADRAAELFRCRTIQQPIAGERRLFARWVQIHKVAQMLFSYSRIKSGKTLQCDEVDSCGDGNFQSLTEVSPASGSETLSVAFSSSFRPSAARAAAACSPVEKLTGSREEDGRFRRHRNAFRL